MVELIDEADLHTAHARALAVIESAASNAVDGDFPGIGPFEKTGDMQEGRLARPRRPKQRHGLAGVERSGGLLQHVDAAVALREAPVQPLEAQRGGSFGIVHRSPYS